MKRRTICLSIVITLAALGSAQGKIVYVNAAAPAGGDGLTWATAKQTVQDGLNAAISGDQVWVAVGTYVQCITLKNGVGLYGGFAGTETQLAERNWATNATILDGNQVTSTVTSPSGATASTRIDGFTVRRGFSYTYGGGIHCDSSSPTISNNTITGNFGTYGGGIRCVSCSPVISNNTITANSGSIGGIYCTAASPTIYGNTISGNSGGSAVYCTSASSPTIVNNTITGHRSDSAAAGGITCLSSSCPLISNNRIAENSGGAAGAVYCDASSPTICNNAVVGNSAWATGLGGGGIYCKASSAAIISSNTIVGNAAAGGTGGGIGCNASSPTITNNIVAFNSSGVSSSGGTPALRSNCLFNLYGTDYSGLSAGEGDISVDPQLVASSFGEVHLKASSPCINAGYDPAVQAGWLDIDGQTRIQGSHVDIGADEFNGTAPSFTATIVRVSPSGDDTKDGSTWALAKRTVQAGIDAASAAGGAEVWVAAGTYSERVNLKLKAHVYGGFAATENSRDQRNPATNVTLLDGAAGGTVVTASYFAGYGWSTIDGFTIRNGKGSAGGIYCNHASPAISNNIVAGNNASSGYGGGISTSYCSPAILNNTITGNSASSGGGVYVDNASPVICNNVINGNATRTTVSSSGGGVYCGRSSLAVILNNTITGNSANIYGGGIHCYSASAATISNNTIVGNAAAGAGGGISCDASSPTISNNLIAFNSSGLYNTGGTPTLRNNCVYNGFEYVGLTAGTGDISVDPQLVAWEYGKVQLKAGSPCIDAGYDAAAPSGSVDIDGQARIQGAHVDIGSDEFNGTAPSFVAPVVRVSPSGNDANDGSTWALAKQTVQAGIDAAAATAGADVWVAAGTYNERITLKQGSHVYGGFAGTENSRDERNWATHATILDGAAGGSVVTASSFPGLGSSSIDGFTIRSGAAESGGGVSCANASPVVSHNTITGNTASSGTGGGIFSSNCAPRISSNLISGNSASSGGGGVGCNSSCPLISNNTISGNSASGPGGGIVCYGTFSLVSQNVITGNTTSGASGYGAGVMCSSTNGVISSNTIAGNIASSDGGGVFCSSTSVVISGNTIAGNSGLCGGALYSSVTSTATISNNNVAFNSSGVWSASGTPTLRNNCVYNPGGANYTGTTAGLGDISTDPLFVNRLTGDYHLTSGSPCIDAGYNAGVLSGTLTDLDGRLRFFDAPAVSDCRWSPGNCGTAPIVDIGAYEFIPPIPGDFGGDGDVDDADFATFASCATGPGMAIADGCAKANLDNDADVDQDDFGILQRCYQGESIAADPNCGS